MCRPPFPVLFSTYPLEESDSEDSEDSEESDSEDEESGTESEAKSDVVNSLDDEQQQGHTPNCAWSTLAVSFLGWSCLGWSWSFLFTYIAINFLTE